MTPQNSLASIILLAATLALPLKAETVSYHFDSPEETGAASTSLLLEKLMAKRQTSDWSSGALTMAGGSLTPGESPTILSMS